MSLGELAHAMSDPTAAALVLAFWVRWEVWARRHRDEHRQLQRWIPHEVTHG